ncbi:MAG TPA: hypothetical protein PL131_09875 [Methylotenera sp.]|nr:hypothetical protein [Methylotenera sp.]HPN01968.1 hypothetical protein [Methylotenera sp.]
MRKFYFLVIAICFLVGCGGIPIRSLPKLMKLENNLLTANPAEFMVAIQVDNHMVPPPNTAPLLILKISPNKAGAFEVIERKIPMHFIVVSANALGLKPPSLDRKWLIYNLPSESQADLLGIQNYFKAIQNKSPKNGGGKIAIGIAQEGVAVKNPVFANTRWESWLQTSGQEGFYELWSGTVSELLKQAETARQE